MPGIKGDDDEQPARSKAWSGQSPLDVLFDMLTEKDNSDGDEYHQYMMVSEEGDESCSSCQLKHRSESHLLPNATANFILAIPQQIVCASLCGMLPAMCCGRDPSATFRTPAGLLDS